MSGALALQGCVARGGRINLESTTNHRYFGRFQPGMTDSGGGEYDIVLVESPGELPPKTKNRPLVPMPLAPLRQVMHIHVYWHGPSGVKDNPAAVNASIDWYILGAGGGGDLVLYEGAGFVLVDTEGERRDVEIKDGELRAKLLRGNIVDPLGHARFYGSATARMNDARVKDTLAQMQEQIRQEDPQAGTTQPTATLHITVVAPHPRPIAGRRVLSQDQADRCNCGVLWDWNECLGELDDGLLLLGSCCMIRSTCSAGVRW